MMALRVVVIWVRFMSPDGRTDGRTRGHDRVGDIMRTFHVTVDKTSWQARVHEMTKEKCYHFRCMPDVKGQTLNGWVGGLSRLRHASSVCVGLLYSAVVTNSEHNATPTISLDVM